MINIGGMTAYTGASMRAHVVTAKAALGGLTRALAHELAPLRITVNCVSPGMVDTARKSASATANPAHHAEHKPLVGRRGHPDEIASAVVWLAGPGGRFTTGQTSTSTAARTWALERTARRAPPVHAPNSWGIPVNPEPGVHTATVTFRKVAGIDVAPAALL